MITVNEGETGNFTLQLADGDTSLFPQVTFYTVAGAIAVELGLVHVAKGMYRASHVFNLGGEFDAVFVTYIDPPHVLESPNHGRVTERYVVTSFIEDLVWDADVVFRHGKNDSAGLFLNRLAADIVTRTFSNNLNSLLGVPDENNNGLIGIVTGDEMVQIDVNQAWTRSLSPSTLRGIIKVQVFGTDIELPMPAQLSLQAYEQGGGALWSQAGIVPTKVGFDTWFDVTQAFTPDAGSVISVVATITGSGVNGVLTSTTCIAFPEF